jgi:hypothetical protein
MVTTGRRRSAEEYAVEDNAMKRRLLFVAVLLSCALAVALVLRRSLPDAAGGNGPLDPASALVAQDLEAQSRDLDRQSQSTDAHREVLDRLSADLIASRRTLAQAVTVLADFSRQSKPEWLRGVGRRYPGLSEEAAVACALVYFTLFRLHDGDPGDEETAGRLAADYLACSGVPLTLLEPVKGAALPPCWRAVAPPSPVTSAEHRPQKHLPPVGALDARQLPLPPAARIEEQGDRPSRPHPVRRKVPVFAPRLAHPGHVVRPGVPRPGRRRSRFPVHSGKNCGVGGGAPDL